MAENDSEFTKFKIKKYDMWDLFLHENQYPYIGRCYAWAKREEASRLSDMNIAERAELFEMVVPEWEDAVKSLFSHDWTNIACLGNTSPHLHWHLIPRYHSPREFRRIQFLDQNPKGNYSPYEKRKLDDDILMEIFGKIKEKIF